MKILLTILAAAIGLMGCTTMGHHREWEGRNEGSSGSSESPLPAGKHIRPHDPYVRDLPKDAETALAKVGIKDMLLLAAVDRHGRVRLLKPNNVKQNEFKNLPRFDAIKQMLVMTYKGSDCVAWSDGLPIKGTWVDPHPEGGMLMLGFCKKTAQDDPF